MKPSAEKIDWRGIISKLNDANRREELADELSSLGFFEPTRARTSLVGLVAKELFSPEDHLPPLVESADPDSALAGLASAAASRYIETDYLFDNRYYPLFINAFAAGPFATSAITKDPELIKNIYPTMERAKTREDYFAEVEPFITDDQTAFMKLIRSYRRREFVRIALRDIMGVGTFIETAVEISDFASASVTAGLAAAWEIVGARHGWPEGSACVGPQADQCGFSVLGMGKLGGRELNFSSDIDLIFFHSQDEGRTTGGPVGALPARQFYGKLAEMLVKLIGENTGDGVVFRVDLNLRPDGKSGPISNTPEAAESYYEAFGQTWERSAMLKARPIAGDVDLGERVIEMIEPFVFRRSLDYDEINRLKSLKKRQKQAKSGGFNLKLGEGGIREIEQVAVLLELLAGGKNPKLRSRNTSEALALLAEAELLSSADAARLTEAYIFLRRAEHRVQICGDRQTHNLPEDAEGLRRLARQCGLETSDQFLEKLNEHTSFVSEIYSSLLEPKAFASGHTSERLFSAMRKGFYLSALSGETEEIFGELAEKLEAEIDLLSEQERTIYNLEKLCLALGIRFNYYRKLLEDGALRKSLLDLFAASDYLSNLFISSPQMIRRVFSEGYHYIRKTRHELTDELNKLFYEESDEGGRLEILRHFKNRQTLAIGLADIFDQASLADISESITDIADLCLEKAYEMTGEALGRRYGTAKTESGEPAYFAIIGMGKLGARELSYGSDLDLIFFFSARGQTDGKKMLNNMEYFSRMAQRIIRFLSVPTREGVLYEVDSRLRPSGSSGSLVTSLDGFIDYHTKSAMAWERQALIKSRFCAGDPKFGAEVIEAISRVAYEAEPTEGLAEEIDRLRGRMETELAQETDSLRNIKTGRGGLVDVEFAVQYLQLRHGGAHPEIRRPNTIEAISEIRKAGLVESAMLDDLEAGYIFLRKIGARLRIIGNRSINDLETSQAALDRLAERLGYRRSIVSGKKPGQALLDDYNRHTDTIRKAYRLILDLDPEKSDG